MVRFAQVLSVLVLVMAGNLSHARSNGPAPGTAEEISALAAGIQSLSAEIDPKEALRAAQVTYQHTYRLAQEYQITDGPLVHNSKVNMGLRPRGLCWHWAQDIEARLKQENFKTLEIHRAVANSFNIRLEHSTAIISLKGQGHQQGIVLDPWRKGGVVFWAPTTEDTRYQWIARDEVLAKKRAQLGRRVAGLKKSGQTRLQGEHR